MGDTTLWWIAMAALVAAEMVTGTFYLLMLALAAMMAALGASMGASHMEQLAIAVVTSIATVVALYGFQRYRRAVRQQQYGQQTQGERFHALDLGGMVYVQQWQADGTARVQYRGAGWQAVPEAGSQELQPGRHTVVDMRGNMLVLRASL